MKKTLMLLILLSGLSFAQTIKVTALPSATKIDRADLLLLTQPATGTPVSKKMSFQTLLDSAKVIIADYTATIPPLSTSMLNSTEALGLPLFHDARVSWQDSINSAFEKIDDKTIFFDENDFTLDDDNVLQLNDILAIDTLMRVNTLLSKDDTSLVTGKGIADYVKRVRDSLNTVGDLTNVAYKGQSNNFGSFTQTSGTFNATSALQLNGTSINTTGTLSKVAYKEQDNNFTTSQSITGNLILNTTGQTRTIATNTTDGTDNGGVAFSGGGAVGQTRGAFFIGRGNEHPTEPGRLYLGTGDVTGSSFSLAFRSTTRISITDADADNVIFNANPEIGSTNYVYFGAEGTDGSWRIGRSGNNLVFERRESGSWVTKQTMTP